MRGWRSPLTLFLFTLVILLLQGTLIRGIVSDHGIVPNLLIPVVVFLAFYEVTPTGALYAFLLGIEFDLFSGAHLGPWGGASVLLFGVIACGAQRIFIESVLAVIMTVFLSSLGASGVYLLFTLQPKVPLASYLLQMVMEALLTSLLAPLIFFVLRKFLYGRGDPLRRRQLV